MEPESQSKPLYGVLCRYWPQASQLILCEATGVGIEGAIISGNKAMQMVRLAGQSSVKSVINLNLVPSPWGLPNEELTPFSFSKCSLASP